MCLQENPGSFGSITFPQFSRLLRMPVPTDLAKSAALARDLLVFQFITKLKAAVAASRAAAPPLARAATQRATPPRKGKQAQLKSPPKSPLTGGVAEAAAAEPAPPMAAPDVQAS